MKQSSVSIEGMTCGGCVNAVRNVLSRVPGVRVDDVGVGKATIASDDPQQVEPQVRQAIERAGFRVTEFR